MEWKKHGRKLTETMRSVILGKYEILKLEKCLPVVEKLMEPELYTYGSMVRDKRGDVKDISDAYVQMINGDEEDVCSDNLELRSKYNGKKIKVVETGQVYSSIDECSNILGISRSTISRCVNYPFYSNRLNYHFEYVD